LYRSESWFAPLGRGPRLVLTGQLLRLRELPAPRAGCVARGMAMTKRTEQTGRRSVHPGSFGWPAWRRVFMRTFSDISKHHLSIVAAGIAFYGVFSIFPGIAALIAVYGLVFDPSDIRASLDAVAP